MAKKLKSLNPIIGTGYKTLSTIKDGEDGNIENFPDTLPKIPRLSYKRLGVSGLEIGWEFEDKIYYTYELYGSTTKGFEASEENLMFQGLASSYFYEAKPGEKWYFKARAKNTHGRYTEFSSELVAYTIKLDNLGEYVEGGAINGALIENATINNAHIKDLHADKITAGVLDADRIGANSITANKIEANAITSEKIQANAITTDKLAANIIASNHIQSGTIESGHIKAGTIESDHIKSNSINSNHIQANTIQSEHIQTGAITAGSGIIAEGAIGSAQISSLDAAKIEAGTIDTSKVTIQGSNGHLRIKGNRLQVFNGTGNNAKERVSLGDVNGNGSVYGLRVRGADGTTILLDENGVKSEGITDGAITNDKISDDANIDGAKLNINSVVNKINEDGTETIQGTKIEVDGTTLNTKLSTITTKQTEDSERISQAQSQITANTNAIKLKVDEQTYTADKRDMTSKLEKNTSEISAMKGQIALKVEQTDIETALNNLEIGGRNLLKGTANFDSKYWENTNLLNLINDEQTKVLNPLLLDEKYNGHAIGKVAGLYPNTISTQMSVQGFKFEVGKTYTVSVMAKGKISGLQLGVTISSNRVNYKPQTINTEWEKYKWTFISDADTLQRFRFESSNATTTNYIMISEIKVEKGEKDTDYTTAIEDTTSEIDTKINTAKSEIKVTTDAISQNVSNLSQTVSTKADGSTVTAINNKVGSLETSVNGISGKVTNLEKTTTNLGNSVSGVQGEVETLKSDVASLEVTTSGISQKVSSVETTTSSLTQQVTTAQNTANSAVSKADAAQSTANTAKTNAATAQSTADSAKTTATNAQNQANTNKSNITTLQNTVTTTNNKVASLETNLNSITSRVSATETTTSSLTTQMNNKENKNDRVIYAKGNGNDAPNNSQVKVGSNTLVNGHGRGLNILALNPITLEQYYNGRFDTYGGDNYRTQFAEKIQELNNGNYIIVVTSHDSACLNYATVCDALYLIGGSAPNTSISSYREAYALIGKSKLGKGNGLEMYIPKTATDARVAEVSVKVSDQGALLGVNSNNSESKIDTLTTRVSSAESKLTKDSLTTTIGNHYTTSTDVNGIVTSKGYQTESQVQQTVNGLQVKVSQSGGYNLLRNTSFLNGSTYWSVGDGRVVDTSRKNGVNNSMKIVSTGATSAVWKGTTQRFAENIPTGKTYRATLYYYVADKSTFNSSFTLELKGRKTGTTSESGIASTSVSPSDLVVGQWTKITVRCTTTQSWDYLYIYPWIHMNGTIWISNPIVTEGELEVSWSPHPSEVYDGITQIDKDGIKIKQSNINGYTHMNASGFYVNKGGEDVVKVTNDGVYIKGRVDIVSGSVPTSSLSGTINSNQLNSTITNDISTAKNNASSAINKANNAQSTANTANSTANANKNNITNLQGEVSTVKSDIASLEVTTSGISQKVSSVESTTATLTNKVNTVESTANSANSKVDNMQIGGRNLLKNTALTTNTSSWSMSSGVSRDTSKVLDGRYSFKSTQSGLTSDSWRGASQYYSPAKEGDKFTFSVYTLSDNISGIDVNARMEIRYFNSSGDRITQTGLSVKPSSNNTWTYFTLTGVCPANTVKIDVTVFVTRNGTLWFNGMQLERGTKATTWTPAVEDVQSQIDTHTTEITTTNNKVSEIKTDLNGITSRVGTVESKQTTTDGKVTGLESRMSNAESKITESAITNTVKKNFYTKSETDNQITSKGYQTQSQVQQTVDGLQVKVQQSGGYNLIRNSSGLGGTAHWVNSATSLSAISDDNSKQQTSCGTCLKVGNNATSEKFAYSHRFLLQKGKTYTVSGKYYVGVNCKGIDLFLLTSNTHATEGNYNLTSYDNAYNCVTDSTYSNGTWKSFSKTITVGSSCKSAVIRLDNNGSSTDGTTNYAYFADLIVEEGSLKNPWSPHPAEVYGGVTTIDKDGITVNASNASTKTIMNANGFYLQKGGTNLFKVDSNGLAITGSISGSNISGSTFTSAKTENNTNYKVKIDGATLTSSIITTDEEFTDRIQIKGSEIDIYSGYRHGMYRGNNLVLQAGQIKLMDGHGYILFETSAERDAIFSDKGFRMQDKCLIACSPGGTTYNNAQLELRTEDGGAVALSLHRNGHSHAAIVHDGLDAFKVNLSSGVYDIYHSGKLPQHLEPMHWNADDLRWVGNQNRWNNGKKATFGQLSGGTTIDGAYPYGAFAQFGGNNATGQIYLPENNASNEMYFRCSWDGNTNNGHWKRVWHDGNIGNPMPLWHKNGHWGMVANDNDSDWIRTTWNGIIPYQSGDCSSLGTDSWRFHYAHINTVQAHSGMYTQWLDDRVGASNWVCVDNANGGNQQITLRPEADNRGNLGHRNYTWNYANITSIGNSYSLRPTDAYSVSKFDNNDLMYDMVKNMNFYLEKEKSVEEFEEVLEIKESEEYQNADEDKQKEMIREVERKTPATYHYSKRMKLVANADELPFEVAPESHVADGSRTIETGAFMAGLASALQKAIEKIETLETKVESLEQEIELLKM